MLLTFSGVFQNYGTVAIPASQKIDNDRGDESFFKQVDYYSVDDGRPTLNFQSELLTHSVLDSKLIGLNPKGVAFRVDNDEPIHFQSKNAKVSFNKKEINLENDVAVVLENTELNADKMQIRLDQNIIYANGTVKTLSNSKDDSEQVLISADSATYLPKQKYFEYVKNVQGTLKRRKKYEESIRFKTDNLIFDGQKNLAELKGDVHFMRDNFDIYANSGNIFLENYNKKLKYYSFSDDVRLEEKVNSDGRQFTRKAFSEKLEGFMSEKKIILTGLPKVFQEKDVIKGNMIVIRENIETVEVDDANTNIILKEE